MSDEITDASNTKLAEHIAWTYFSLRFIMFGLSIAFPISLWVWSSWHFRNIEPGPSISGYYHAENEWIRDHFVGTLSAVGVCLIAYRGFSRWENILLNGAGFSLIGVAMFPTGVDQAPRMTLLDGSLELATSANSSPITLHGVCAVLFFICLAAVALTQAEHSLHLIEDPKIRRRFARRYRMIGGLMVFLPAIAWAALYLAKRHWGVFMVEALGVFVFAGYWITKTLEYRRTNKRAEAILLCEPRRRKT
ncbi:MAG: hypothetical protein AAGJ83_03160 [Planctomycetota bacterium]